MQAKALGDDIIQGVARNYTISDVKWVVPISPDRNDTVMGTIQDVVRHLENVAPDIAKANFPSDLSPESTSVPVPFDGALVKTTASSKIECDVAEKKAWTTAIMVGIQHLSLVWGTPGNTAVCPYTSLRV